MTRDLFSRLETNYEYGANTHTFIDQLAWVMWSIAVDLNRFAFDIHQISTDRESTT